MEIKRAKRGSIETRIIDASFRRVAEIKFSGSRSRQGLPHRMKISKATNLSWNREISLRNGDRLDRTRLAFVSALISLRRRESNFRGMEEGQFLIVSLLRKKQMILLLRSFLDLEEREIFSNDLFKGRGGRFLNKLLK